MGDGEVKRIYWLIVVTKGRGTGGGRYLPDPKTMRMSPLYTFPYIQVSTVLMPLFVWGCVSHVTPATVLLY